MPSSYTFSSKHNAEDLATSIKNYWVARNYLVEVVVEEITGLGTRPVWIVKSDMVNGRPRTKLVEVFEVGIP